MGTTEFKIIAGSLKFHLQAWGNPARPPLLLLHGLASTSHIFDLIAPVLAEHFYVLAVDQRGHGLSDKPDTGYDFETVAVDIDHLLGALQLSATPISLIGHSWGAYTALYYAATRPHTLTKVGLIDGGIRSLQDIYPTWAEAEIGMAPPQYVHMTIEAIRRMIRAQWLRDAYRPELEPLALSVFDLSDEQAVSPHLSRKNHMEIAHQIWAFNSVDYYERIQCPVLIVNAIPSGDTPDPKVVQATREAERHLRDVEVIWMGKTIHDIPWHRPAELSMALQKFLLAK
ncbi:MAG: alpha/beta hydrolase [Anaerolineae bacterium]|nr:alpha/beta hydrolase [Anaerolineae bacterium]